MSKKSLLSKLIATGLLTAGLGFGFVPCSVQATIMGFNDQALFLAATGAMNATGLLPNLGLLPGGSGASQTVGTVTFSIASPSTQLYIGYSGFDWTALLPGNDIAISGVENINAAFASPVFSVGFDFVEPSTPGTCFVSVCTDSTFAVTLKNSAITVDAFTFNAPNDVAAFIGVWSDKPFDRVEIRETVGTIDDEFFGQFYSGALPLQAVPEPASLALLGIGLAGLGFMRRRWT